VRSRGRHAKRAKRGPGGAHHVKPRPQGRARKARSARHGGAVLGGTAQRGMGATPGWGVWAGRKTMPNFANVTGQKPEYVDRFYGRRHERPLKRQKRKEGTAADGRLSRVIGPEKNVVLPFFPTRSRFGEERSRSFRAELAEADRNRHQQSRRVDKAGHDSELTESINGAGPQAVDPYRRRAPSPRLRRLARPSPRPPGIVRSQRL
jgi:hypothetical protein